MNIHRIVALSSAVTAGIVLSLSPAIAQRAGAHGGAGPGAHAPPAAGAPRPDHPAGGHPPSGTPGSETRPAHPEGSPPAGAMPPFGKSGGKHGQKSGGTPPFAPPSGG